VLTSYLAGGSHVANHQTLPIYQSTSILCMISVVDVDAADIDGVAIHVIDVVVDVVVVVLGGWCW